MAEGKENETLILIVLGLGALWILNQTAQRNRLLSLSARTGGYGGGGVGLNVPGFGAFQSGRGGFNLTIDPRVFGQAGAPPISGFPSPAGPAGGGGGLPLPGEDPNQTQFTPDPYSSPDPSLSDPLSSGAGSVDGAIGGAGMDPSTFVDSAVGVTPFDVADGTLSGAVSGISDLSSFGAFGF